MYGAIYGDLAGSIYEYQQFLETKPILLPKELILSESFFSDDTILKMAILDAMNHD